MQIGMIGLGRMGATMVRRLLLHGHDCVVFDAQAAAIAGLVPDGARAAHTLAQLVAQLAPPRAVWIMLPAAAVDDTLALLTPLLSAGDLIIDGGNSHHRDDIRRAAALAPLGLQHLDVGTSGGVAGLQRGYCLMVGAEPAAFDHLRPVFQALAPGSKAATATPGRPLETVAPGAQLKLTSQEGYLHCGGHGAGHFVKMVHNGIEYGLMAAYAEGFNLLRQAHLPSQTGPGATPGDAETAPVAEPERYAYDMDLPEIAELWRRGSVVGSWLLDLTASALQRDPTLNGYSGRVSDSGEGRWTVEAALDLAVPVHVLSAALFERFASRDGADFANRVLSAMRHEFGGHVEKAR